MVEVDIKSKLESVPALPGVYLFKDEKHKIIYIGKGKNLRNRVRSYFRSNLDSPKTEALVKKINNFDLIITDTEVEALVLENNLIKEHKPRYNINLKDDKTFPFIKITNEDFPQVFPTRDVVKDGGKYFGPYTDVKSMKISLRMINKIFKIRSCKFLINDESIRTGKVKVCLDYHIKKCEGPCEGFQSKEDYAEMVEQVIKVLKGKTDDLIPDLRIQMEQASKDLKFEKAASIRDKLEHLEVYLSKQKVVSSDFGDKDIICAAFEGTDVAATILNIRNGKLVGKKQLKLSCYVNEDESAIYSSVIKFYYGDFVEVPKEIIVESAPEESATLLLWLNEKANLKTKILIPKRKSNTKSLVAMCKQNAILQLKELQLQRMKKEGNLPYVLSSLKRDLRLKKLPRKIECFDISNLQGTDTVASMVVFVDGKPKKSLYRKYIIKSVEGPDDFASMNEVLSRRYSKLVDEKGEIADLIVVDGGKGQLSTAVTVLENLGIKNFEIIGLAKRLEEIFFPGILDAQTIPKTSSSLKLLQHVRDEAHRFAIAFHRSRRDSRTLTSELLEIKGIGEKLVEKLLKNMGSLKKIKSSSKEEISKIVGNAKAELIFNHFNNPITK